MFSKLIKEASEKQNKINLTNPCNGCSNVNSKCTCKSSKCIKETKNEK